LSTFGDRFKKLRLSRNLMQEQLAEEFNEKYNYSFTKATISQYENNKRTPEMSAIMNFVDYFQTLIIAISPFGPDRTKGVVPKSEGMRLLQRKLQVVKFYYNITFSKSIIAL